MHFITTNVFWNHDFCTSPSKTVWKNHKVKERFGEKNRRNFQSVTKWLRKNSRKIVSNLVSNLKSRYSTWQPGMFNVLQRFIFKYPFWQNMVCYGTSEYCAWLSHVIMFYMTGLFLDGALGSSWKWAKASRILDPGLRDPNRIVGTFLEILVR